MLDLFEFEEEITHAQFLHEWKNEEEQANHSQDGFTLQRINELQPFGNLKYCVVKLRSMTLANLVLGEHMHDKVSRVGKGGEAHSSVIAKYQTWRAKGESDDCFARISEVERFIDTKLQGASSLWDSEFILGRIFMPGNQPWPGYYRTFPYGQLCALNFHRFVAYGLWCAEHGYQPAKVHYIGEMSANE